MTAMTKLTLIPILLKLMLRLLLMTMTIISYCHVSLIPKIPYIVILCTPERWDTLFRSLFRFVFIFLVCFCVLNVYQSDHMLLSDGINMVSGLGWAGMNKPTSEQMDGFNELSLSIMGRDTHKYVWCWRAKSRVFAFSCSLVKENEIFFGFELFLNFKPFMTLSDLSKSLKRKNITKLNRLLVAP